MEHNVTEKIPVLHIPRTIPIDILFENLVFTIQIGRKARKTIIDGVSGKFRSGELTAIMGPSGAGKTSLLNILTGLQTTGVAGHLTSEGLPDRRGDPKQYNKHSRYILQEDNLDQLFTVLETMQWAAELKLGDSVSPKAKKYLINDILVSIGLIVCQNTRCKRLSGGQKKRLSIALELIDNPPIMFLDEPTTGLDSLASYQCVSMLKSLAQQGRNIICTIHQPSAILYEMFDFVYVMAEGKCIYQGASLNTVSYLSTFGLNCPQYHNPADYLLDVASGEFGDVLSILSNTSHLDKWRNSAESIITDNNNSISVEVTRISNIPESTKLAILIKRSFWKMYRDWTISSLKVIMHVMVGIFLGFTYYQIGNDGSKTINNVGFLLVSAVYLCYTSLMPAVLKFPSELAVLKKEAFNDWYKLRTYYVAFLIADFPMQFLFSAAYTSSSYFISAQPVDADRFMKVLFIFFLVACIASSQGVVFGTSVNPVNGTFLGAITTALFLVLAGFLILFTHMPKAMYFLSYTSYFSYALDALVQALYGYNREEIPCPEDVDYCPYTAPDTLLKEIGMYKPNYWWDVLFLLGYIIALRILAFCTLRKQVSSV